MEFIRFIFSGFWVFIGFAIVALSVLSYLIKGVVVIIHCILKQGNIRKHGYPPIHCDADEDYPRKATETDELED